MEKFNEKFWKAFDAAKAKLKGAFESGRVSKALLILLALVLLAGGGGILFELLTTPSVNTVENLDMSYVVATAGVDPTAKVEGENDTKTKSKTEIKTKDKDQTDHIGYDDVDWDDMGSEDAMGSGSGSGSVRSGGSGSSSVKSAEDSEDEDKKARRKEILQKASSVVSQVDWDTVAEDAETIYNEKQAESENSDGSDQTGSSDSSANSSDSGSTDGSDTSSSGGSLADWMSDVAGVTKNYVSITCSTCGYTTNDISAYNEHCGGDTSGHPAVINWGN